MNGDKMLRKSIAIIEGMRIKRYNLGSMVLPMTVVRKHLFRTDERYFYIDRTNGESILFTDLESTQAYGNGNEYIDPNDTLALLDTAPTSKNASVGHLSLLIENPMVLVYAAVAVVILLSAFGVKF